MTVLLVGFAMGTLLGLAAASAFLRHSRPVLAQPARARVASPAEELATAIQYLQSRLTQTEGVRIEVTATDKQGQTPPFAAAYVTTQAVPFRRTARTGVGIYGKTVSVSLIHLAAELQRESLRTRKFSLTEWNKDLATSREEDSIHDTRHEITSKRRDH